jgi:tRNA wybutosine-synthesizing protein 4
MWLHYDVRITRIYPVFQLIQLQVMANVLCQIRGSKRLFLFPPTDISHLEFEPGASSTGINCFERLQSGTLPDTHPHEAVLLPGDVLFLPPLWPHTASPTSGLSIAVNVFFRNLQAGYAAGRDVYGNRDLQVYEKGRQDVAKVIKTFDNLPMDMRVFYLSRLAREFEQMTL